MRTRGCGHGIRQIRLRLVRRGLVVLRINRDKYIAGTNKLAFNNVYLLDVPTDSGTQGHNMSVYLRVIGVFVAKSIPREIGGYDGNHDHSRNHEDFLELAC